MTGGLTDSYAPLLPSILWSATALDIEINPGFRKKASSITLDNYNKLSYASKVLLGQTITSGNIDCEDSSALEAIKRDTSLMQYRYEQIELRDNSRHYKEFYGIDIALEIQNTLKQASFSEQTALHMKSDKYNLNKDGYLLLAQT